MRVASSFYETAFKGCNLFARANPRPVPEENPAPSVPFCIEASGGTVQKSLIPMHASPKVFCLILFAFAPEMGALGAIEAVESAPSLSLDSPVPYAVFQRSAAHRAKVPIAGRAPVPVATVEARAVLMPPYQQGIDGRSGTFTVIASPKAREFSGTLEVPAGGWYALTVRTKDARGKIIAEGVVNKIGVGEVFVAAGHSFCGNSNGEAPSKAQDDRVATCGDWWSAASLTFRHCEDPLRPGDADRASPWPSVGDVLVQRLHVPVLFVNTGAGGTTAEQWRKAAEDPSLKMRGYPACRLVLQQLTPYTGLRAVVWFGNENDLGRGPTAEAFSEDLRALIAHSRIDSGCPNLPWVIAFDAYDPAVTNRLGAEEKQRRKECLDRGTEMVLQTVPCTFDGPQTDDLGPDFRRVDRDHFNEVGLQQLGLRFARKIEQAFFASPVPSPQEGVR